MTPPWRTTWLRARTFDFRSSGRIIATKLGDVGGKEEAASSEVVENLSTHCVEQLLNSCAWRDRHWPMLVKPSPAIGQHVPNMANIRPTSTPIVLMMVGVGQPLSKLGRNLPIVVGFGWSSNISHTGRFCFGGLNFGLIWPTSAKFWSNSTKVGRNCVESRLPEQSWISVRKLLDEFGACRVRQGFSFWGTWRAIVRPLSSNSGLTPIIGLYIAGEGVLPPTCLSRQGAQHEKLEYR